MTVSHHDTFALSDCLEPAKLPPYYFIILGNCIRVVLFAWVFGPPKAQGKKQEGCFAMVKSLGMLMFRSSLLCLAVYTACQDVDEVRIVLQAPCNAWTKLNCIIIVLVSSPNALNALAVFGSIELFSWRRVWQELHNDNKDIYDKSFWRKARYFFFAPGLYDAIGVVGMAYYYCVMLLYGFPCYLVIFTYTFPAVIVYCWFFVPLLFVMHVVVNPWILRKLISLSGGAAVEYQGAVALAQTEPEDPVAQASEDEKAEITVRLCSFPTDPYAETFAQMHEGFKVMGHGYDEQLDCYNALGTPKWGIQNYLPWFTVHQSLIQCASIMIIRLICGRGYWASFSTTVMERHIMSYLAYSAKSMAGSINMVQIFF